MQKATEYFASFLDHTNDMIEISGRLAAQKSAEKLIASDISQKLKLGPEDRLLEIGCGAGNLLIPLSFAAGDCIGVDHRRLVEKARERFCAENVSYVEGYFPQVKLKGTFDKILIYSVLAYMEDRDHLYSFLSAALQYLKPSGRMLIGDIVCVCHKERFVNSEIGKDFQRVWQERTKNNPGTALPAPDCPLIEITDETVAEMLLFFRRAGYHSYVVEQDRNLPFGNSREDMVIVGPENTGN